MKNRRCTKFYHKKYRRYASDIWGRLALKKRDNFITNLVYSYAQTTFSRRLRKFTPANRKKYLKIFRASRHRPKPFAFQINTRAIQKRKRISSRRGSLLKMRRQISLFYGGGRIRQKTFRRYGDMPRVKSIETLNPLMHYEHQEKNTYTSIIESRLDVLLLRSNFVDSVYKARHYIFHRKCKVQGCAPIKHPAFLIQNFQIFTLTDYYTKKLRKSLFTRIKKHAVVCIPSYLYVNFTLMIAFKIEDPNATLVSYPFAEKPGALANFRRAYQLL